MIISVDYDGTYSADPTAFDQVIYELQCAGHDVIMVTARTTATPVTLNPATDIKVYYTAGKDKDPYMRDKHEIDVDIWIEDRPQGVGKTDDWNFCDEAHSWYKPCECLEVEATCALCDGSGKLYATE